MNEQAIFREANLAQFVSLRDGGPSDQILDHFWSGFRCMRKTVVPGEKPTEAGLDCKPSAHKCRDQASNLGLIGAKRGNIHCAILLPQKSLIETSLSNIEKKTYKADK